MLGDISVYSLTGVQRNIDMFSLPSGRKKIFLFHFFVVSPQRGYLSYTNDTL